MSGWQGLTEIPDMPGTPYVARAKDGQIAMSARVAATHG